MGAAQQRLSVPAAGQEGGAGPYQPVRDGAGCFGGCIHNTGRRSPRYHKVNPHAPNPPDIDFNDERFWVRTVWIAHGAIRRDWTHWWRRNTYLTYIWDSEKPHDGLWYEIDFVRDKRLERDMSTNLYYGLRTDVTMVSRAAARPEGCRDHALAPAASAQLGEPAANPGGSQARRPDQCCRSPVTREEPMLAQRLHQQCLDDGLAAPAMIASLPLSPSLASWPRSSGHLVGTRGTVDKGWFAVVKGERACGTPSPSQALLGVVMTCRRPRWKSPSSFRQVRYIADGSTLLLQAGEP